MKNPEGINYSKEIQQAYITVAKKYLNGEVTPNEDTPPWINQILKFHVNDPITPELIAKMMQAGHTDQNDPWESTL